MTYRTLYGIALAAMLGVISLGFFDAHDGGGVDPATAITTDYLNGIDTFRLRVNELSKALERFEADPGNLPELRETFSTVRFAYKRIEFMVGYFNTYDEWKLNGAPLPKIDESTLIRQVIQPEGMQVIEELLYSDDPAAERQELRRLVDRLGMRAERLQQAAGNIEPKERRLFEAMRDEVLRVLNLGLAGFDSPGALNGLPEAAEALEGVRRALRHFYPALDRRSPLLREKLAMLLEKSIGALQRSDDFEAFDRLHFYKEYGNPLYELLLDAHYALGIPTYAREVPYNRMVRYESNNIFNPDAFDPSAYSPDPREHQTKDVPALGELLFFDPVLSGNVRRSCASCHHPGLAFADGKVSSPDITGSGTLHRNTPTLVNASLQGSLFWDGRVKHLEHQIEDVLLNHSEMHTTFETVITTLRQSPEYRELFGKAYLGERDTAVTKYAVVKALATYVRSLTALNSPFDRYIRGESDNLPPAAKRGFNLFMGKAACGTCHFAPLFSGTVPPRYNETEVEILGVPSTPDTLHPVLDDDPGRAALFGDEIHRRAFKTPTVRNAELTAPYMHNGVYRTLEEVVEFYNRGGGIGLGLDVPNQTLPPDRLNLSRQEIDDLVAFMNSLTDTTGLNRTPARLPGFPDRSDLNGRPMAGAY